MAAISITSHKNELHEYLARTSPESKVNYTTFAESGGWRSECRVDGQVFSGEILPKKVSAEQSAARVAYLHLKETLDNPPRFTKSTLVFVNGVSVPNVPKKARDVFGDNPPFLEMRYYGVGDMFEGMPSTINHHFDTLPSGDGMSVDVRIAFAIGSMLSFDGMIDMDYHIITSSRLGKSIVETALAVYTIHGGSISFHLTFEDFLKSIQ